jgi:polysaccharide export outer membrane protein
MKNIIVSISKFLIFITILAFLFSSCVSQKKIKYLQQKQKEDTNTYFEASKTLDYKVQPKDNLYIRIMSPDEKTNALFNTMGGSIGGSGGGANAGNEASLFLTSYSVSEEGYIEFPILGKIFVRELTVEQIKNLLQQLVDEYIKDAVVIVRMVNFKITLLGETGSTQLNIYQNKINIFEVIAMGGDLTDFANKKNVFLVRQVKGGSKIYNLDLTSNKILSSDLYYLAPNDILYFAPLRAKQFGFTTFPYGFAMGVVTFFISLLTLFQILKL